ncbi:Thiamine-phosphate pyrophosphorylase, partial [Globisporangium splendens]
MKRRRLLTLIVHAPDLTHPQRRLAIECALHACDGGQRAIDFLQLRCTAGGIESTDGTQRDAAILHDARMRLQELLEDVDNDRKPALVVNAPLAIMRSIAISEFDGWHVKERDLQHEGLAQLIQETRAQKALVVGCSVHSVASALLAARMGVDYIQVGTMFPTPSHPEKATPESIEGPQLLREILTEMDDDGISPTPPLIGVGGINTAQDIQDVLSAGASGVAMIRGILAAEHASQASAEYRRILDQFQA